MRPIATIAVATGRVQLVERSQKAAAVYHAVKQDLVASLPLGMNDHMQPEGAAGAATHAELIRWRG